MADMIRSATAVSGPLSAAFVDVIAERRRQIDIEGFTAAHDDTYQDGQLHFAGAAYAVAWSVNSKMPWCWPWAKTWWKPKSLRENLVRAAALIIAAIEQIDRKDAKERAHG